MLGYVTLVLLVATILSGILKSKYHKTFAQFTIFSAFLHVLEKRAFCPYGFASFIFLTLAYAVHFERKLKKKQRFKLHVFFVCLAILFLVFHLAEVGILTLRAKKFEVTKLEVELPSPKLKGEKTLEETLAERRSIREYLDKEIPLEYLSQILWAAQGITSEWGGRTAPSAGALYPLEIYVVVKKVEDLENGVYHYIPQTHSLELIKLGNFSNDLAIAALGQGWVREAPVKLIVTAEFERTTSKYGERGIRYVYLEAGHAAQNVYLQVTALDLGCVVVGAFHDSEVQNILSLPKNHEPIYIIPIGFKK
jgi:SagB-type dehydrogenase family enzyme